MCRKFWLTEVKRPHSDSSKPVLYLVEGLLIGGGKKPAGKLGNWLQFRKNAKGTWNFSFPLHWVIVSRELVRKHVNTVTTTCIQTMMATKGNRWKWPSRSYSFWQHSERFVRYLTPVVVRAEEGKLVFSGSTSRWNSEMKWSQYHLLVSQTKRLSLDD